MEINEKERGDLNEKNLNESEAAKENSNNKNSSEVTDEEVNEPVSRSDIELTENESNTDLGAIPEEPQSISSEDDPNIQTESPKEPSNIQDERIDDKPEPEIEPAVAKSEIGDQEMSDVPDAEVPKGESVAKVESKLETLNPSPKEPVVEENNIDKKDDDDNLKADSDTPKKEGEQPEKIEEPAEEDKERTNQDAMHKEEQKRLDYSNYSKKQMVQVLESLLKEDDYSQVNRILKEIKNPYELIVNSEQKKAFEKYKTDGGEKDGFEYRSDELDQRYQKAFGLLKERKNKYFNSLEKQKEQNLNTKLEILEKIRELVDSEETGVSIKTLKELQKQWKEVGQIASAQVKGLWANYNALLDRFYDQRSIYFELKELDRKKNYDLKLELCEKAEKLADEENIREAIKHLNELHEEFKHIGPVPKEDQEVIWGQFKAASDKIYSRRKDFYEKLKGELKINEEAKVALVEKLVPFSEFSSDKISDWNSKTKELVAIQREWEAIGSLPKEKAKSINKQFWTAFKSFFNKKGQFFKKIEEVRRENLKLKQDLVAKAESLKDSEDFRKTSDELKQLQKEWKDIGPVPEKYRNEVYLQFKKACDSFFERRRANSGKVEKDYEENLKKKQLLCEELEKMVESGKFDIDQLKSLEEEWGKIGFVPKADIRTIQKRYIDLVEKVADKVDLPEAEKHKIRFLAQFNNMNYGPGAEREIQKKEGALRRQISNLENDINLWKNNLDFFAASKNADKLKKDFLIKIDKASAQAKSLKEQLKVIMNI